MLCKVTTNSQLIYSFLFLCLSKCSEGHAAQHTSQHTQRLYLFSNSISATKMVYYKKNPINTEMPFNLFTHLSSHCLSAVFEGSSQADIMYTSKKNT